jgi:hypothetical protein
MKMDEPSPPPPTNLPSELHGAFRDLCERLRASGAEICPVDAVVIARTVQAEAALQRAREAAAKAPLCVDSPANGESLHPLHRHVGQCESNLRAWLRLLPKPSGGGLPVPLPHVAPPVADTPPAAGPEAAGCEPAAGGPPERVKRLQALLREFRTAGSGTAGGVGGAEAG